FVRCSLLQDRACADIRVVVDMHIAVAHHTGREGHEIADHAIVRDIGVDVGVKVPPDADRRGQVRETAQYRTLADIHIVVHQRVRRAHVREAETCL
ncbi:hypothetical protein, partial [Escherichia coli]|uniref:hypothetical protein n=1 Tax=Escherichia coli TaxID=562 RepID=UPI00288971A3